MEDQELLRYSRQIMLPEIDLSGQEKLASAQALIVGLGGLGSPVGLYLAAAGVGSLALVDHDLVDLSNLQRQIIHSTPDIGRSKVASAADAINKINPLCKTRSVAKKLGESELATIVSEADVVLDCSDNFETRFAVNAACVATGTPLVSGAAIRWEGQVSVFTGSADEPCYRCLYAGTEATDETCSANGVIAPLVGIIGSVQATEAIKLLAGAGRTLIGRLLLLDALRMEWRTLKLPKDPACPVCGAVIR